MDLKGIDVQAVQENIIKEYDKRVNWMRQSPYMDYPAHVHMETMSLCNASCHFCPYPTIERKGNKMPDNLIDKIISDLKAIPVNLPFQFSPFKVNEPFLDKRLFDILFSINHNLPNATITLTTNASPLTEDKLEKLNQVRNLGYLWVSFNDHREKQYEDIMQIPYARTIERLNAVHKARSEGRLKPRVVLSRVRTNSAEDAEFCHWVKSNFPLFEYSLFQRGNWLGDIDASAQSREEVPDAGCLRWFDISITSTGEVAHCCMDGKTKWPIGDVAKQHVLDIYNSPEYRKLREKTISRKQATPCNSCTFL